MKNKKGIIILFVCVLVVIIFCLVGFFLKNKTSSNNESNSLSIEELIIEDNYKKISENNELLNIFNSLKKYVYNTNRNGTNSFSKIELFSIVGYNVKEKDITNTKDEGDYTYGYINKELLDKQIAAVFGKGTFIIGLDSENSKKTLNSGVFENAGDKFKNAVLMEETKKQYYFRFYTNEGTSACPKLKNIPIKLIEVRQIDNNILLVAKSVQTRVLETEDNQCSVDVINYTIKDPLDTFKVAMGEASYTVDIDKYIENAMDVYVLLKKENNGKYVFVESKIGE